MGFCWGCCAKQEDFRTQEGLLRATRAATELAATRRARCRPKDVREAPKARRGYDALRRD
jgi:hypothetical protein